MRKGYVYILSNYRRTTFYIGVSSNLPQRKDQHDLDVGLEFVKKYKLRYLVYIEIFDRITDAIQREKQLKKWHRDWKIRLIKSVNPDMRDLSGEIPW